MFCAQGKQYLLNYYTRFIREKFCTIRMYDMVNKVLINASVICKSLRNNLKYLYIIVLICVYSLISEIYSFHLPQ